MYPPTFEYRAPSSLEEALALLADNADDARILAGGQSLIPMMKLRLATPAMLIDINNLTGLDGIEASNGHLSIGALVRHNDVVRSATASAFNHTVAAAAPWIADPIVRNRGTLCGSVAHCDPEGDWNSVLLATGADVVAVSRGGGERVIPITDFVVDFFTNALQPGEMVKEVRIPGPAGPAGGTYLKLERKIGDYATVGVATHLELDAGGAIAAAGIAMTSVNPINTKATDAEQILVGQTPSDELFAAAADAAAAQSEPDSDVRGPAEYKRHLVRIYTRRGLDKALELATAS